MDIGGFVKGLVQNVLADWIALGGMFVLATIYAFFVKRFGKKNWPVTIALGLVVFSALVGSLAGLSVLYSNLNQNFAPIQSSLKRDTLALAENIHSMVSEIHRGIEEKHIDIATAELDYLHQKQYITVRQQDLYDKSYRGTANALRSKFERIGSAVRQSDALKYRGTSLRDMRYVAEDLERLAASLPD